MVTFFVYFVEYWNETIHCENCFVIWLFVCTIISQCVNGASFRSQFEAECVDKHNIQIFCDFLLFNIPIAQWWSSDRIEYFVDILSIEPMCFIRKNLNCSFSLISYISKLSIKKRSATELCREEWFQNCNSEIRTAKKDKNCKP